MKLYVFYFLCRLLMMTWRVRVIGFDRRRRAAACHPRGSFIFACFHENASPGTLSHPGQGIACLVSHSKDGELVAFVVERIGLKAVRGSSSRGGREARDEIIDGLEEGTPVAITVDGPKGPRRVVKSGVVDVAKKSGAAIIPLACAIDRAWILRKTWDQTRIPKPFARVVIRYGEPIMVPEASEGEAFEALKLRVQEALHQDDEVCLGDFESLWSRGRPMTQSF
jgi:lysophospholipid acyltransferase (LPLAT)-like uncharacterized protein